MLCQRRRLGFSAKTLTALWTNSYKTKKTIKPEQSRRQRAVKAYNQLAQLANHQTADVLLIEQQQRETTGAVVPIDEGQQQLAIFGDDLIEPEIPDDFSVEQTDLFTGKYRARRKKRDFVLNLEPLTELELTERATKENVGIRERVHPENERISGVLKARYEDFHVSEISLEGKVARLTSTSINSKFEDISLEGIEEDRVKTPQELLRGFVDILGVRESELLIQFLVKSMEDEGKIVKDKSNIIYTIPPLKDKEARKTLHEILRKEFPDFVSDTTHDGCIRIILRENMKRFPKLRFDDRDPQWAKDKPAYLRFVLHKKNIDTIQAINLLSRATGCKTFKYAGTKDRRAITSQYVTAWKLSAEKLTKIAPNLGPNVMVGNFAKVEESLQLGQLQGNRFKIVLRDVQHQFQKKEVDGKVRKMLEDLKNDGFINYFGMQRFGTGCVPTHSVGRKVLQDDIPGVCRLILAPRDEDVEEAKTAKKILAETGDFKAALRYMPVSSLFELYSF
jgi:tRNA pseudouridine13 synthase